MPDSWGIHTLSSKRLEIYGLNKKENVYKQHELFLTFEMQREFWNQRTLKFTLAPNTILLHGTNLVFF
jgi:hypothetical protein